MASSREKIAFIINPASGIRPKRGLSHQILDNIDAARYEAEIFQTQIPGHATSITREALSRGVRKIIAVGGDGTVNEIARALIGTQGILGIIPRGSGNGLARHFRIPISLARAMSVLSEGKVIPLDYGMINDIPFFCTAGVGFDAHVGKKFAELPARGIATYVKASVLEFFRYRSHDYTFRIQGHKFTKKAFLVTFANASQFGNEAYIAPHANASDGLIDMVIFSPFPVTSVPDLGVRLFTRRIDKSRYIDIIHCREAEIELDTPVGVIHYDGEPGTTGNKVQVKVRKGGLHILVPGVT